MNDTPNPDFCLVSQLQRRERRQAIKSFFVLLVVYIFTMSSTPNSLSVKEYNVAILPHLLSSIVSSSPDLLPTEADIERLRKEVEDVYAATRKQANRYQKDLESLMTRHGTADQARRRDVQKSTVTRHEEGTLVSGPTGMLMRSGFGV